MGDIRLKRPLADHGDLPFGDMDRADRFLSSSPGDVLSLNLPLGIDGGARGVRNLSSGFMVL